MNSIASFHAGTIPTQKASAATADYPERAATLHSQTARHDNNPQPYPDNRAPQIVGTWLRCRMKPWAFRWLVLPRGRGVGFGTAWYSYRAWWSADGAVRIVRALGIGVEGAVRIAGMLVS